MEGADHSVPGVDVRLRSDYRLAVRPFAENEDTGYCRVRIYEPLDPEDHHVILVEEVIGNPGPSTVNAIEFILSDVFTAHRSIIDVESTLLFGYRPRAVFLGIPERLDRITVVGWRMRHMPFPDHTSPELGGIEVTDVEWMGFDRNSLEILTGSAL